MAEAKSQRPIRCQNRYVYDRLSAQKMSQVYHWLAPEAEEPEREQSAELNVAKNEKERSDLRASFL